MGRARDDDPSAAAGYLDAWRRARREYVGARAVIPRGKSRASILRVRGGCRGAIARWDGKMLKILDFWDEARVTARGGADVEAKRTNRKTDDGERGDTNSKPHINTLHRHKYGISFHLRIRERGSPG